MKVSDLSISTALMTEVQTSNIQGVTGAVESLILTSRYRAKRSGDDDNPVGLKDTVGTIHVTHNSFGTGGLDDGISITDSVYRGASNYGVTNRYDRSKKMLIHINQGFSTAITPLFKTSASSAAGTIKLNKLESLQAAIDKVNSVPNDVVVVHITNSQSTDVKYAGSVVTRDHLKALTSTSRFGVTQSLESAKSFRNHLNGLIENIASALLCTVGNTSNLDYDMFYTIDENGGHNERDTFGSHLVMSFKGENAGKLAATTLYLASQFIDRWDVDAING